MQNNIDDEKYILAIKALGILSIIIGIALALSLLSIFTPKGIIQAGSGLIPNFLFTGILCILGGIAVINRKEFGRWLFIFFGLFNLLQRAINIPLNIYHLSKIETPYPHAYTYPRYWIILALYVALYLFLMIFFSSPNIKSQFK